MTTRAGTYFPIRASGYKPAPAPYWNELINAQNLVGIGTAGLLTQAPNIIDNSNSLLSNKSAQDVINSHLSQENNYKTWDFGYKMSEADARAKGYIITPEPTVTEEERKRSLTLPNIPPEIEQGWVEDFPIDDSKFPTHTGGGILEPPTFKDMTSGGGFTLLDEKDKIPNILYNKELRESATQVNKENPFLYDIDPSSLKKTEFEEKDISNYEGDKSSAIIATIINGEYHILDGHHKTKLAEKENTLARVFVIPEKAYKEMKEKGIHQANMFNEFVASYDLKEFGYNPVK